MQIISETGLKTKEEKIFAICFAEERNNLKMQNPKGMWAININTWFMLKI